MGTIRQESWSGLALPSSGNLPDPEIKPTSPTLPGRFFTSELPGKLLVNEENNLNTLHTSRKLYSLSSRYKSYFVGRAPSLLRRSCDVLFCNRNKLARLWFLEEERKCCCYCCSVAKSCPTLCNPVEYGPTDSSVLHYLP